MRNKIQAGEETDEKNDDDVDARNKLKTGDYDDEVQENSKYKNDIRFNPEVGTNVFY